MLLPWPFLLKQPVISSNLLTDAAMRENAVQWLVVGTIAGAVTASALRFLENCCGRSCSNVSTNVFQYAAALLHIRHDVFENVPNIQKMPRLFEEAGFETHSFIWKHDANAVNRDCVQWGCVDVFCFSWRDALRRY